MRANARKYKLYPEPEPLFSRDKSAGGFRVFVVGESGVQGIPYEIGGFPDWLRLRMQQMCPERNIEVINAGNSGWRSTETRLLLQECLEYRPDLIIWMAGHNEFVPHNVLSLRFEREHPWIAGARDALLKLATTHWLRRTLAPGARRQYVIHESWATKDRPCAEKESELIKQQFRAVTAGAVSDARAAGVPIIICNNPRNWRTIPPESSLFSVGIEGNQQLRERWNQLYEEAADGIRQKAYRAALDRLLAAAAIDTNPAKLHFALGQVYESLGRVEAARGEFSLALTLDGCPGRAPEWIGNIIKEECTKTGAPLADLESIFNKESAIGVAGDELVCDHAHPNLRGHERIASEILNIIERTPDINIKFDRSRDITMEEGRKMLGIDVYESYVSKRSEALFTIRMIVDRGAADEFWSRTTDRFRAMAAEHPDDFEIIGGLGILNALGGDLQHSRELIEKAVRGDESVCFNYIVYNKTEPPFQNIFKKAGVDLDSVERLLSEESKVSLSRRIERAEPRSAVK